MNKLSIRDLDLKGKRVFIRVDFNVPLDGGKVGDDTRIRETLPTLQLAMSRGARLILASHLGRPKGKVDAKYSLAPVAARLQELLGKPVAFVTDCVGAEAEAKSKSLRDGEVLLLENVRFHPEEEANDPGFAKQLADLCDGLFVCDAFGSAHRAHASVVGITKFVRQAAAGLLMEKELTYLGKAISNPDRPFISVLGGAKVSDKIEVVRNLMKLANAMLIGGAMAYTFLKAQGLPIGKSLVENDKLDLARELMLEAAERKFALLLPVDHVLAESPNSTATMIADIAHTPDNMMGLDIGPQTVKLFSDEIAKARTIVWNGPLGMFEKPQFAQGTLGIARAVAAATRNGATSIIGGGDSVAAVEQAGVASQISHISTGGGASLEFLAGDKLPGVEALTNASPVRLQTRHQGRRTDATPRDRRELEDVQDAGGDARILRGVQAARRERHALRHHHRAALHFAQRSRRSSARQRHFHRGAELRLARGRRIHRRNFHAHDSRHRLARRDHRPLRAPPAFRRDGRIGESQSESRARSGTHAHRLRGRASRRARSESHSRRAEAPI